MEDQLGLRGRTIIKNDQIYFVTTTTVEHTRVFIADIYCDLLVKNILHYQKRYQFTILGYVIMPSHFHWILKTNYQLGSVSDIMRDIKKYSAWDILGQIEKSDYEMLRLFQDAAIGYKNQKRKLWMPRFDDQVIRNAEMFWTKLNFIHNNPVKAGITMKSEDYKYSSARNYAFGDNSILKIDTSYAVIQLK